MHHTLTTDQYQRLRSLSSCSWWTIYYQYCAHEGALKICAGSALNYTGGFLASNRVQFTLTERNKYGLGGAIYVQNDTFILRGLNFAANSAFLGGALFASSDFSRGASLSDLTYGTNSALLGKYTRSSHTGQPKKPGKGKDRRRQDTFCVYSSPKPHIALMWQGTMSTG